MAGYLGFEYPELDFLGVLAPALSNGSLNSSACDAFYRYRDARTIRRRGFRGVRLFLWWLEEGFTFRESRSTGAKDWFEHDDVTNHGRIDFELGKEVKA